VVVEFPIMLPLQYIDYLNTITGHPKNIHGYFKSPSKTASIRVKFVRKEKLA